MEWAIIIGAILVCGQLWRMGGDGQKWARAVGCPLVICLAKFYVVGYWQDPMNWLAFAYFPAFWAMTSGFSYGVTAPPHKFWAWVFRRPQGEGTYEPVEILTRATCGFFWSLASIPFVFCGGSWLYQILYTVFLTVANGFFGRVKNVEISERAVGTSVATALLV